MIPTSTSAYVTINLRLPPLRVPSLRTSCRSCHRVEQVPPGRAGSRLRDMAIAASVNRFSRRRPGSHVGGGAEAGACRRGAPRLGRHAALKPRGRGLNRGTVAALRRVRAGARGTFVGASQSGRRRRRPSHARREFPAAVHVK